MNKMEKGYTKVNDNIYFRSRKEAAMYDERLSSRERASELLGVSVSSLADYELGNTKVVPVDKVDLMAQLYKAPQLRTQYCKAECPIGKYIPMATELKGIESVVIQLIQLLDESKIEDIKKLLLSVASDGQVDVCDIHVLKDIKKHLEQVQTAISSLSLLCDKEEAINEYRICA